MSLFTDTEATKVVLSHLGGAVIAAATLVVDFQIEDWSQIRPGEGSVMDFVRFDGRA